MAVCLANGLKALFLVMGCVMVSTLIYTIYTDGLPFHKDLLTPWMAATLIDFSINIVPFAVLISYILARWIVQYIILVFIATCAYIFMQLHKLSSEQSLHDPLFHVLMLHPSKDAVEKKSKHSAVLAALITFTALGCLMLATLIYTLITDGSPFREELLTPWMTATLVDFYINVVALSVWVMYKESSWISASIWMILLICFGSITTCAYIVQKLLHLSSQDPLYLLLANNGNRAENRYETMCLRHEGLKLLSRASKQQNSDKVDCI
ncbi:LOW QUALITY PROTEIN: DUF1475 domain-containing protein [Cephalotus follicularis]|uniref:DUF1475 domain-containing protein n=1 Tax=Cephalotus follicularis TaxID=3775 RepID=A0A1Q3CEW4_CEPFO|nr:LOW QUALITY PROTEIN: DUF1475 domain-containing protein [Cephalotus follicularis]